MNNHRTILLFLIVTALACVAGYALFDAPVALFFRAYRESTGYAVWKLLTRAGESQWYLVAGLLLFAVFRKSRPFAARAGLFLFSSVAVSGIAADLLKMLFGRARPRLFFQQGVYGFDLLRVEHAWISFPSGHAATAASAALTLSLLFPRFRAVFLCAGTVIALSRVVLTQHYLSDVIAGAFLGVSTVLFLYRIHFQQSLHESRSPTI